MFYFYKQYRDDEVPPRYNILAYYYNIITHETQHCMTLNCVCNR